MSNWNWVKDQFLQRPVLDPWVSWTLEELQAVSQDFSVEPETRKRMRIEIQARRQGKRAAQNGTGCP